MKTKEYLVKYNLQKGWKSRSQNAFIEDITADFEVLLEKHKANDNLHGFTNAVNEIKSKWVAISNKIPFGIPDTVWSYFYAAVVSTKRDQMCEREMKLVRKRK